MDGQAQTTAHRLYPNLRFLRDGGEMGEIIRNYDWAATPIGTPDSWPQSLRTTLGILLHSAFPMFLFWGKDLLCFYNDAYRPSLGDDGKHPAIGKKAEEVWPDIWDFISPLIRQVKTTEKAVWYEDQLLPIYRNGHMEDVYWTFSYSPAYGDDDEVAGVFVTCTETTRNVQLLRQLQETENRFQRLITQANVGIVMLEGEDCIVTVVNDAYGRLIDRTAAELQGKPLFDVIPEAATDFKGLIDNVRLTGEPFTATAHPYLVYAGDKKIEGYLNFVYQPYYAAGGSIAGVMALCQDVTEQVEARRQVEISDAQARAVIESAPFPIGVYTGREMKIILANQSIIDVWGKGPDVIGKRYAELLPELAGQQIYEQLDEVYSTGIPFHVRGQQVDLVVDGRLQPFYFNYSFTPVLDGEGKVYGVMNTAAEVTDLYLAKQQVERNEQNIRNIILQAPVAMCILLGPEHVIDVVNDAMLDIWGKPKDAVMHKPVFEALPDAREQGLEAVMRQVYSTGEPFRAYEQPVELIRYGRQDTVYQNFVYEPYRNTDGEIIGILAISLDVTQQVLARRQIEEIVAARTAELAAANHNLRRSNNELEQFAYVASHDLQEPLRKVSTFTGMLEHQLSDADDTSRLYIDKIKNASTRMLALIRDVLAYSQLTTPQEYIRTDLQKLVQDTISDHELIIAQKSATVTVAGMPVIEAIPLHMSQLFGNLVSNALKFTRPGVQPVISITSSPLNSDELSANPELDPAKNYYCIEVKDNGIGFSPEYAAQIFNIFQRLHGKSEYEGTGIGLAICKKIAENHHGSIAAFSEQGRGSTFRILLPEKQ